MVASIGYNLGIGSGLDITSLVEGLANAERAPKEALIERREQLNSARISSLGEIASAIDSFASALSGLIRGGTLFSQPSVSDNTVLSATAIPGKRLDALAAQMEVLQLAKAQTLESAVFADSAAAVGEGELTLTTKTGTFSIVVDASNDSLAGLADAINAKNAGVSASIITDQNGARLVLKGGTGETGAFTLAVPAGTATGLERFTYDPNLAGGMTLAQAAQDATVRLDGVEVRRSSNSFNDLIEGVRIDLKRAAPGSIVSLGVTRPTAAIEQAMGDFVAAYNELASLLTKATAPGLNGAAAGPLRGDVSVRELQRRLSQLPSEALGSRGSVRTLADIGVATNRDGTLSLNQGRLQSRLESDPQAVEALFNPSQYSSDPSVGIVSAMGKVKPGVYHLTDLVPESATGPATGNIDGIAALSSGSYLIAPAGSAAIGLTVDVKGPVASATVTVDAGLGGALQGIRDALRARLGPIANSQKRLEAEARSIAEAREKLETRSKARYESLVSTFMAMERRVTASKATQSYLEQQIEAWNSNG